VNKFANSRTAIRAPRLPVGALFDTPAVSIHLLHRLARAELPVAVSSGEEVDLVRVLNYAGHVKAMVPAPVRTLTGYDQPPATVLSITRLGKTMLNRFPQASLGSRALGNAR
jgi:hypothetical protein